MRQFLKKYAGALYVVLITAVVIAILSGTNELGQIWQALGGMDARWVWASAGCIALYLFLRMATLRYYLARKGHRITWLQAAGVTGAGQFYSAITPSASGGQPMQVLWMHRLCVPASIGTSCVSAKFLGFQTAYLCMGGVLLAARRGIIRAQLDGLLWLVAVGYVINAALIVCVILTLPKSKIVDRLIRAVIRLGEKLRLIKDGDKAFAGFRDSLKDYREALAQLLKAPVDALAVFGLSVLQVIAFMAVAVCMYRAFGLSGVSSLDVLTIQLMLFIAAAFVPLPGAAGAQESGFCAFFRGIFPDGRLIAAMVCWRFFSYYLLMAMGLFMMGIARLCRRRKMDSRMTKGD